MPSLVIKSLPESIHSKLKQTAAEHRRSITQEAIVLLERALSDEAPAVPAGYWANRKLEPEWEEALEKGAFAGGTESTEAISRERDAS